MSIVGTRPPLISETNLYEPHHKVTYRRRSHEDFPCLWNYRFSKADPGAGRSRYFKF